jgi:hypothetical protein
MAEKMQQMVVAFQKKELEGVTSVTRRIFWRNSKKFG